jgi:hypothetical protein
LDVTGVSPLAGAASVPFVASVVESVHRDHDAVTDATTPWSGAATAVPSLTRTATSGASATAPKGRTNRTRSSRPARDQGSRGCSSDPTPSLRTIVLPRRVPARRPAPSNVHTRIPSSSVTPWSRGGRQLREPSRCSRKRRSAQSSLSLTDEPGCPGPSPRPSLVLRWWIGPRQRPQFGSQPIAAGQNSLFQSGRRNSNPRPTLATGFPAS